MRNQRRLYEDDGIVLSNPVGVAWQEKVELLVDNLLEQADAADIPLGDMASMIVRYTIASSTKTVLNKFKSEVKVRTKKMRRTV